MCPGVVDVEPVWAAWSSRAKWPVTRWPLSQTYPRHPAQHRAAGVHDTGMVVLMDVPVAGACRTGTRDRSATTSDHYAGRQVPSVGMSQAAELRD